VDACDRYLNAIHELVDGTLGPIRRAELELHLETCDGCRALADDLKAIAASARSLEVMVPPDRVWQSISAQLRADGRITGASGSRGHRNMALFAIAAALIVAVGASLLLLNRPDPRAAAPAAQTAAADGNAAPDVPVQMDNVATELARTEMHFQNAIEQATKTVDGVDPATAAVLQKNLLVVNEAIAESRKALEANPQNASAQQSLYDVLKKKIQFLQDTIALMNEMRQGDAAGAAEIVEGGKS
jgi:anti-sigma factor RsiW